MAIASSPIIHQTPFFVASNPSWPSNLEFPSHRVKPPKTRVFLSYHVRAFASSATSTNAYILGAALSLALCLNPRPYDMTFLRILQHNLVCTFGPMFFVTMKDRLTGYFNTPLTVLVGDLVVQKHSCSMLWRTDQQVQEYLINYDELVHEYYSSVFDTLDVSPLLVYLLGTLGSILNNSKGSY
ncbi:hypothetical protein AMTRI_Chr11g95040 [Amborella trichopoda]